MAGRSCEKQDACRLQRLTVARSQITIDSFPRALSLIENSHSNFVSAIGCFIGRLYLVSQPRQEFTSTVERLKACCDDFILTTENIWLRLNIGAQMIKTRLADTRTATQSLMSAIGTLTFKDVSNRPDGCTLSFGRQWSNLFTLAMNLFGVSNSLVSDSRSISTRLSLRQRELKGRHMVYDGASGSEEPKYPQTAPHPAVKSKSTFSVFPRCAASLDSRKQRTTPAESTPTASISDFVHSKTLSLHCSSCSGSYKTPTADRASIHESRDGPHYRPALKSQRNAEDDRQRDEPASTLVRVSQKHDYPIDTNHPSNTAERECQDSVTSETHSTTSVEPCLEKAIQLRKIREPILEWQHSLLLPRWPSRRPLSSISERSEPCLQSWREASLTPCGLRASHNMVATGGHLARLVRLHRCLRRKFSSYGNSCKKSMAGVKKSFVDVKRRSSNAMARMASEHLDPCDDPPTGQSILIRARLYCVRVV